MKKVLLPIATILVVIIIIVGLFIISIYINDKKQENVIGSIQIDSKTFPIFEENVYALNTGLVIYPNENSVMTFNVFTDVVNNALLSSKEIEEGPWVKNIKTYPQSSDEGRRLISKLNKGFKNLDKE